MRVAPAVWAARPAKSSTSAWLANPLEAFSGPLSCSSGSHSPVPSSSNLAAKRVPLSSSDRAAGRLVRSKLSVDTYL